MNTLPLDAPPPPGHNLRPEEIKPNALQRFQKIIAECETFHKITPTIKTKEEAEAAKALVDRLRVAYGEAEAERKANNQPHDAAIKANNDTFRPHTTKADNLGKALKKAGGDYIAAENARLEKERADAKRIADAAAAEETRLRKLAEDEANKGDLAAATTATAAAEAKAVESATTAYTANAAPKKVTIGGGGGRVMTTRTTWKGEIVDLEKAVAHYSAYPDYKAAIEEAQRNVITKLATADAISFKDAEMAPAGVKFVSDTTVV